MHPSNAYVCSDPSMGAAPTQTESQAVMLAVPMRMAPLLPLLRESSMGLCQQLANTGIILYSLPLKSSRGSEGEHVPCSNHTQDIWSRKYF